LLLVIPTTLVVTQTAASAALQISLLSEHTWTDSAGYPHCVGEVKNTGSSNADFIRVSLNEYDASDHLLATDFTYTLVSTLAPSYKSGFEDIITAPPTGFDHCTVAGISAEAGGTVNYNFSTNITNVFTDQAGYRHYVGTVTNNNYSQADFVRVNFTFYAGGMNTVDADFTYIETDSSASLPPGGTASFEELESPDAPAASSYAALTASDSPPSHFSPQGVGQPAATIGPDGTQLIFWQGAGGHLDEVWWNGHWNGPVDWTAANGWPASVSSAPSIALTSDDSQIIFWQGPGSHLVEVWWNGHWNGPVDWSS